MKNFIRFSAVVLTLFVVRPVDASIVGYVNRSMSVGDNLIENPILSTNNNLSALFGPLTPTGTTISLWNPSLNTFDVTSTFLGGLWSSDLTLLPGTGAKLTTISSFTNTFVGEILTHSGAIWNGIDPLTPPSPFAGPNGVYLLGDKAPANLTGTDVFLYVLGRSPNVGEKFTRLNEPAQTYVTSTWLGGSWDVAPTLNVGESGFYNVGPVPEPSSLALGLVGCAILAIRRRKL